MFAIAGFALTALMSPEPSPEAIRASVEKALPLLQKGAAGHAQNRTCFACHNQGFAMVAFHEAREHGFKVDDAFVEKQVGHVSAFFKDRQETMKKGSLGGGIDTAGWALYFLDKAGAEDESTTAVVEYILKLHENLGGPWRPTSSRPPTQGSLFTSTYVALRALNTWGTDEQSDRIAKRVDAAREWLVKTPAKDNEDRVYRLRALKAASASDDAIRKAADELREAQRPNGGWSQKDDMPSDPYATATSLAALREVGGMPTASREYKCGVAFLLLTQSADGSWHVKTRSKPIQQYFETGFPHSKDQFISAAATSWAATALMKALPVQNAAKSSP